MVHVGVLRRVQRTHRLDGSGVAVQLMDSHVVLNAALDRLKAVGFRVAVVSQRSEACYLQFPGCRGYLRVALHKGGPPLNSGGVPVVYRLTLQPEVGRFRKIGPGGLHVHLEGALTKAIGTYFLRAQPMGRRVVIVVGQSAASEGTR